MDAPRHVLNVLNVLITGSSTGIGRACALHLAARGWKVWAGVRRESDGAALAKEAAAGTLTPLVLDVTDAATIAIAAERVRTATGAAGLAGLVNNAGIGVNGPLELVGTEGLRRQFEVNVFGQMAVTRAMLPLLRTYAAGASGKRPARIVMISSIAGRVGQPILGPYCASKFALEALSDALRMELASQRIGVSLVEPGAVKSEIWRKGLGDAAAIDRGDGAGARYAGLIAGVEEIVKHAERSAIPASRAARAVERCLTARRAPVRVLLGRDARMGLALRTILPTRVFDALMVKVITLAGRKSKPK